jgi:SAM-dependent methyltransferase
MVIEADLFGLALHDFIQGTCALGVLERDDGLTAPGVAHAFYVAEFDDWPRPEQEAIALARGRIIDVGCGAGRVALHLQKSGQDVVSLDSSPLAIATARFRGAANTWCASVDDLTATAHVFDTFVLFGNNLGVFGTPAGLRWALTQWARRAPSGARILAESVSPVDGGAPAMSSDYCRRNRNRGFMPGQLRARIRYKNMVGPWFFWLFLAPLELDRLLPGTGWRRTHLFSGAADKPYVVVLEKGEPLP